VYIFCFLLCLTTKLEFFNFFIVATYFRFETHSLVFHHFLLLFIQILSPLFSSLKERQRLCVIVFVCIRVGYASRVVIIFGQQLRNKFALQSTNSQKKIKLIFHFCFVFCIVFKWPHKTFIYLKEKSYRAFHRLGHA